MYRKHQNRFSPRSVMPRPIEEKSVCEKHFPSSGEATISGLMVVADEVTGLAKKVQPIISGGVLQERK